MISLETLLHLLERYKYLAMFGVIFLSGAGLPVPEELALIASGLAVGWEVAEYRLAALSCVLGILASDTIIYGMGRGLGPRILGSKPLQRLVPRAGRKKLERLFDRNVALIIFIGRFIPLVRVGIFFYAGRQGVSYPKFILVNLAGALISGPTTIWIGSYAARQIAEPEHAAEMARHLVAREKHWLYAGLAVLAFVAIARWLWLRRRARREEGRIPAA